MPITLDGFIFASSLTATAYIGKVLVKRRIQKNQTYVSITQLDKDLWTIFSKYIRKRESDWKGYVTCFTCPTYDDWRTFDAGHYLPQALGISVLKFHEKNVHPQCINCNRLKGGNYQVYKQRLILKYGEGIIAELNSLRNSPPMTISEYRQKINYYSQCFKLLAN